ncbi:hypothetical protein JTB14_013802 [Gonioctena quinquepunctata]|nr:hypothetical protein JTB14_013802 [Gonioctena quinquepunctata]
MKRTLKNPSPQLASKLCTTYILALLEFVSPTWSPWLVRDKAALEKVQRNTTRWPLRLRDLPYDQRLQIMGLTLLEDRPTTNSPPRHRW